MTSEQIPNTLLTPTSQSEHSLRRSEVPISHFYNQMVIRILLSPRHLRKILRREIQFLTFLLLDVNPSQSPLSGECHPAPQQSRENTAQPHCLGANPNPTTILHCDLRQVT